MLTKRRGGQSLLDCVNWLIFFSFLGLSFTASDLLKVNDKLKRRRWENKYEEPVEYKPMTSVCCCDSSGSEQLFLQASGSWHAIVPDSPKKRGKCD